MGNPKTIAFENFIDNYNRLWRIFFYTNDYL